MRLRRRNRVLKLPLHGIEANVDLLYDGSLLLATTGWWNNLLTRDREFAQYELIPFDQERKQLLISAVEPANRWTFQAVGDHVAGLGKLSAGAVALSYALARTFRAGVTTANDDLDDYVWRRASVITEANWKVLQIVYSPAADWHGYEEQTSWWGWFERGTTTAALAVRACRWAYHDQIRRWGDAVGIPIHKSLTLDSASVEFMTFPDLLFDWGGRILSIEEPG
jgi:hypothetical protein